MIKRASDVTLSIILVVMLFPLLLLIAVLVRILIGSPVLFSQDRPGLHGKVFKMYKFRTMTMERDSSGKLLADSERMTKLGRVLRSTSLDELPELYNILLGDMSFVGPRPLLVEYLELYTPEQARRHNVLPGITGWAQINGRNAISWEERFGLDIWYVENQSFWLDLKIMALTVKKVLSRADVNASKNVTMKKFRGS